MSRDRLERAVLPASSIALAAVSTTETCRAAQAAHRLGSLATIALGRLLTATALASYVHERPGAMSVQVLGRGRLGPMFVDITNQGHLRGFVRHGHVVLPLLPGERPLARRAVGHVVGEGTVSVIRTAPDDGFTQSATELRSGEVDEDVAALLEQSDQVPTVLVADVLLDEGGMVARAGGVIAQGMPGADLDRLGSLRQGDGAYAALSDAAPDDPARWLSTLAGDTRIVDTAPVEWRCRCSHDRVVAALRMLGVEDLADMVQRGEPAEVRCDFCAKTYEVAPDEVARVYAGMIEAKG